MTGKTAKYQKPRASEHQHQCKFFVWFRSSYPKKLAFAIPNGGARNAVTGAMLKREGVTPGIPDIMVASPSNGYPGLFIEMKVDNGAMSKAQLSIKDTLESEGYQVVVCKGFDDAERAVRGYFASF